jgi:hypothetical protein
MTAPHDDDEPAFDAGKAMGGGGIRRLTDAPQAAATPAPSADPSAPWATPPWLAP